MTLRQASFVLITALGLGAVAGAFFVATGIWTIDEAIYMLSADTFLETRQFILQNGYEKYGSADLTLLELLSVGPHGLAPQYPVGSAVIGAGFVALFDEHGFYVMNAVAAFGTLFVTRALAIELFDDERVAFGALMLLAFASYATEYAFGLWPHMVSVFSVTASFWIFLRATQADNPLMPAVLSGLALGAGLLFRVDGVLLLPVIALLAILYAARPLALFVGGAIGLAPGLAAMAYANSLKFGTWNPISYGGEHAGEDLFKYLGLMAVSVLGLLAAFVVRSGKLEPTRLWLLPVSVATVVAIIFVPQVSNFAERIGRGFVALIVDSTATIDPRPGVAQQADGTLLFWGLPKKALGQSLPWIGCLLLLIAWPWGARRRAIISVLVFAALWMFPFVIRSWHGGLSLNMRYFLPVLPALCILAVWIIKELMGNSVPRLFLLAVLGGFAASSLWASFLPSGTAGAHQILPTYVFLLICAASVAAGFIRRKASQFALLCIGIGIGQSAFLSANDIMIAQASRSSEMLDFSEGTDKELVFDIFARSVFRDPNQIFAVPHWRNATADPDLVTSALADGYRVLMHPGRATGFLKAFPRFQILEDVPLQGVPFQSIGLR